MKFHLIKFKFNQIVILSTWNFINLIFFINLSFHQLKISSNYHLMNLNFIQLLINQLEISSTCHFINLLFHQLVISSTWHFINLTFHQLDISSTIDKSMTQTYLSLNLAPAASPNCGSSFSLNYLSAQLFIKSNFVSFD